MRILPRALLLARQRAVEDAKKKPDEVRRVQARHERAALLLRKQANQAIAKGESERAVRLLQGAVALKADPTASHELAQAQIAAEKAARQRAEIEQKKRDSARQAELPLLRRLRAARAQDRSRPNRGREA